MTMGDAMRITPLDIQQMVFKVSFRGYEKEEVNRFLEELAQTVESLNRDNAVQREKIIFLEQQLAELKRTEATLSSTLLSAQSLAEDVKRNAQREADLVVKEAELKAGELIRQARVELTDTQRDLSSLRKQRLLMVERLRASLRMFERMLEVEEQEAFHDDAPTASEEKLEGESSPAL
jgi:cell division initiation protein